MAPPESAMERPGFEEILKSVGGASYYQFLVFILMTLMKMYTAMMSVLPVFIAFKQDYKCRWNETANATVPGSGSLVLDQCHVYRNETPDQRISCSQWDFDTSIFQETIRSRYMLICGRDFLAELSTTFFFIGFVFGSALYGWISDRIGRLPAILISASHLSVSCAAAALSPEYWMFACFRFLAGIANGGLLATSFTMMSEVTDVKHRFLYSVMVHNGFSYGSCLVALIAFFIRDPLRLQLIVAGLILTTWTFPLMIPESPRWLYTTGRWKRAEKALKYIARLNRREFPKEMRSSAFEGRVMIDGGNKPTANKEHASDSIVDVFRRRRLTITTIINWYAWFTVSIGFFASIYTLGDIGGDIFLNMVYSSVIELPARVLALIVARIWGRIPVMSLSLIIGSIGCFVNAALIGNPSLAVGLQVMSVFNKFWFAAAFDTIWTYSGELYPTVVRSVGLGLGSMWARIGGTLAPQVRLLFVVWAPLPLLVMGGLPLIAGLLILLQPETLNKDMLETIKDMYRLVTTDSRLGRLLRNRRPTEDNDQAVSMTKL